MYLRFMKWPTRIHTKDARRISINSVFVCMDATLSSDVIRLLSN